MAKKQKMMKLLIAGGGLIAIVLLAKWLSERTTGEPSFPLLSGGGGAGTGEEYRDLFPRYPITSVGPGGDAGTTDPLIKSDDVSRLSTYVDPTGHVYRGGEPMFSYFGGFPTAPGGGVSYFGGFPSAARGGYQEPQLSFWETLGAMGAGGLGVIGFGVSRLLGLGGAGEAGTKQLSAEAQRQIQESAGGRSSRKTSRTVTKYYPKGVSGVEIGRREGAALATRMGLSSEIVSKLRAGTY